MMRLFLVLIFFVLISLIFIWRKRYQRQIKRWKKALALDKHLIVFHELYASVDGFSLSQKARSGQDSIEFVYGEIDFESFIALLSLCELDTNTVFYDLGSGTGKAVLACAMVFNVGKSCGIELFSNLHHCADLQRRRLETLNEYHNKSGIIAFKQGDFLDIPLTDATLIFINSTAFFAELWLQISLHLEQIQPGAIVITTSKALASKQFTTKRRTLVKMSWGIVPAFIQQRSPHDLL
jgi:hypothetical protein